MRTESAPIGSVVIDSLPFSQAGTQDQANGLRAAGVHGVAVYLGVVNAARVAMVLAAGMGCFGVTLAGAYNAGPGPTVASLKALGLPQGSHVFLDMEGQAAFAMDPAKLIGLVNAWADGVRAAGYKPGLYVGAPQPLTSAELWSLHVELYWKGQGRCVDRKNALAEPTGGWAMDQKWPSRNIGSPAVWVDMNMTGQDYKTRTLVWAKA